MSQRKQLGDGRGSGMNSVFAEFSEMPISTGPALALVEADSAGEDTGSDVVPCEDGEANEERQEARPTAEEVATRQARVVRKHRTRVWKHPSGVRFQSRCFAVEWRGSTLLDLDEFEHQLLRVLEDDDASFVLGREVRKSRADYYVVVRLNGRVRWRDCKRELMFGHGGEVEEEALFMRVQVPVRESAEGTREFVEEMMRKCEQYPETSRYNEEGMVREHSKSYARPGRRKMRGN